jgi:transcriptional regulator with XRE-family HTH domain
METSILTSFGKRIKNLRLAKGLSQEQLALKADLDRSYLSDIERGLRNLSLQNIEVLARALEVLPFQLFAEEGNILEKWQIEIADLDRLILENPSLRGYMLGYLAEAKLRTMIESDSRVSDFRKYDDHDRKNKHDLEIKYKGKYYSVEVKSLQTNTVKLLDDGSYIGRFQCDASDKRNVKLPDGGEISTTCLRFGDFDILAVNLFAFRGNWEYGFALNKNLPSSDYAKYPEEVRKQLIKSIIPISLPLQQPFVNDIFILLEQLHQSNER